PLDNRSKWESAGIGTVTEASGSQPDRGFGAFGIPHSPRARLPLAPSKGSSTSPRHALQRVVYTRGATTADTVAIHKHYELRVAAGAIDVPALKLTGEGEITFDLKDGLPRDVDFKATLTVSNGNKTQEIPPPVSYHRLE